jgi:hypothetical protein
VQDGQFSFLAEVDKVVEEKPNRFTTSKGLVLKLQKVNNQIAVDTEMRFPKPKPPMVYIKDDDRYEENPNDPTYLDNLTSWRNSMYENNYNLFLGLGVVREFNDLPEGMIPLDSDDWAEDAAVLGLTVPTSRMGRMVAWLRYHVLDDADEVRACIHKIAVYSGLAAEEEVQEAVETFPSDEERGTTEPTPINGNS